MALNLRKGWWETAWLPIYRFYSIYLSSNIDVSEQNKIPGSTTRWQHKIPGSTYRAKNDVRPCYPKLPQYRLNVISPLHKLI